MLTFILIILASLILTVFIIRKGLIAAGVIETKAQKLARWELEYSLPRNGRNTPTKRFW
jgi:hypothetical protein